MLFSSNIVEIYGYSGKSWIVDNSLMVFFSVGNRKTLPLFSICLYLYFCFFFEVILYAISLNSKVCLVTSAKTKHTYYFVWVDVRREKFSSPSVCLLYVHIITTFTQNISLLTLQVPKCVGPPTPSSSLWHQLGALHCNSVLPGESITSNRWRS